jgi:hypothetical protein
VEEERGREDMSVWCRRRHRRDEAWSPGARLLAGAKCVAGLELRTERREAKPAIAREDVEARVAGLATLTWAHPDRYCSDLDMRPERAAVRERPLDEE